MIGFYDYTVIATYLGLMSAVLGIRFAMTGNTLFAVYCLMISGFCDMFDGKIARTKKNRTSEEQKFGIQIDSLSDLVCFGVLPSVIGYHIGMSRIAYAPILVLYVLNALIRLAYYNVTEDERQKETCEVRKEYEGLPVTSSAILIPIVYCFRIFFSNVFTYIYAIAMFLIAVAFISPIKIKKPDMKVMTSMTVIGIATIIILIKKGI